MLPINRLHANQADFTDQLRALTAWDNVSDLDIESRVREIISQVRQQGDAALLSLTAQFDRRAVTQADQLEIPLSRCHEALAGLPAHQRHALEQAAERIRAYHQHQVQQSWQYQEADGTVLGQQVTALSRVGLYVPGGKAAYPSSVLMNAIPAKVAGVAELVMVVPAPDDALNELVLAAAAVAGVDRVFSIGGAQAVAALAYGTEQVPAVDKIVGPGNIYVATAKRQVFGQVGIDMIAGPSEICVISDGSADPEWLALDLFSQAEHDEDAQSILISHRADHLDAVIEAMQRLLPEQPRKVVIEASLRRRGVVIEVESLDQAIAVSNQIAPEHLQLAFEGAAESVARIEHAGAIFVGIHTPEALGDYCAGPNHVLPTSGAARFSSPLGVYDFQKRSSVIHCSAAGASTLGRLAKTLAEGEGLYAHAASAAARVSDHD